MYGDYACPYTYVTRARLATLRSERPLRLAWRPLELRRLETLAPPDGKTDGDSLSWGQAREALEREAADAGVPLVLPPRAPDTRQALQASEFARDVGAPVFERLHGALFRAVFVHGEDIGRRERLLEVAEREGVDRSALAAALEDGRYEEELDRALEEAARYGIRRTPTLLFGRHMVVGAAPLRELREAARRATRSDPSGG